MSDSYFAPMYGGLMIPSLARHGSNQFQSGSGIFGLNSHINDAASPFSGATHSSPFSDSTPRHELEAQYFGHRGASPRASANLGELENFSFKRLRSLESGIIDSSDVSPMHVETRTVKVPRRKEAVKVVSDSPHTRISAADLEAMPVLKLGDEGRAKLKSALSERAKSDADAKDRIDAIGKIRLASMQQLMQMARVSGLWDYAQALAVEHDMAKAFKRSG